MWGLAFLNGVTFVDCEIEKEDEEDEEKEEGEHVMLLVRHQLRWKPFLRSLEDS